MSKTTRVGAVLAITGLCTLGCGGLGAPTTPAMGDAVVAPAPVAAPAVEPLSGKWCMNEDPYCYLFDGEKVMEDVGGPKWQEWGTFVVEDDLLILTWKNPHEVMTWQILRRTPSMLVLLDIRDEKKFSMAAVEEFPPYSQRPK